MRPQAQGKFHYLFGNELLVAPIYADKLDWTCHSPRAVGDTYSMTRRSCQDRHRSSANFRSTNSPCLCAKAP